MKKTPLDEPSGTAESTNHLHGDREEEKDGIFFSPYNNWLVITHREKT
jgi:hypothetical protein